MKKLIVLLFLVLTVTTVFAQLTAWPKNVLAELFTTTQCTNCPDAYAGLEIVHNQFDYGQFNSIRYYSSEGGGLYGSASVEPRFDYYGITFTPQAIFNGTDLIQGSGPDIADGSQYLAVVSSHQFDASCIKLTIDSFDRSTGDISVTATLMNNDTDITDAAIRFALVEDDLSDSHTRVVRYITKSDFSIENTGQPVTFQKTLEILPDYVQANLQAVVFVQLPNHQILQSASTYPANETIRIMVPFNPNTWDANYDPSDPYYMYEGEFFPVINTSNNPVTIQISCEYDNAPEGWDIGFCDHSNCYLGTVTIDIPNEGEGQNYHEFHSVIMPTSEGEATYHFTISIPGTNISYTVPFYYSTSASAENNIINPQSDAILYPAYPNPFNVNLSKTQNISISFSLNKNATRTKLSIYNVKGQKVRTLKSGYLQKGNYTVNWNLRDDKNKMVANGIYFYILDVNEKRLVKKLTVLK